MDSRTGHPSRCGAVWATATAVAALLAWWLLPGLRAAAAAVRGGDLATTPFEDLLVWWCSAAALLATGWLWAVTTVVTLDAARGRDRDDLPGVPPAVRRVLLAACGVALAGGVSAPALATPGEVHHDHTGARTAVLSGLPLPDRATGGRPAEPTHGQPGVRLTGGTPAGTGARSPRPEPALVQVEPGDSLWRLAARDLPAGADDARVSTHWRAIYALNRAVIGADPDLIHPDQQLRLPRD